MSLSDSSKRNIRGGYYLFGSFTFLSLVFGLNVWFSSGDNRDLAISGLAALGSACIAWTCREVLRSPSAFFILQFQRDDISKRVDQGLRKKASRRARLIALATLLGATAFAIYTVGFNNWNPTAAVCVMLVGVPFALSRWKAARLLDLELETDALAVLTDPETQRIVQGYEAQIRRTGTKQLEQGSLSVSSAADEGVLSIAQGSGTLSTPED